VAPPPKSAERKTGGFGATAIALTSIFAVIVAIGVCSATIVRRRKGLATRPPQPAAEQPKGTGAGVAMVETAPGPAIREGDTPLHAAARAGNYAKAKELVFAGAGVNDRNQAGFTPLELVLTATEALSMPERAELVSLLYVNGGRAAEKYLHEAPEALVSEVRKVHAWIRESYERNVRRFESRRSAGEYFADASANRGSGLDAFAAMVANIDGDHRVACQKAFEATIEEYSLSSQELDAILRER